MAMIERQRKVMREIENESRKSLGGKAPRAGKAPHVACQVAVKSCLKAGDVVRLKSGGPQMTVNRVTPAGQALVQWFERETPHEGRFSAGMLEVCPAGCAVSRKRTAQKRRASAKPARPKRPAAKARGRGKTTS